MIYIIPILFFFVSFVFSMLGMGGSQLYIPIMFWIGMDFKTEAIPLGLMLNIVSSSSAAYTYCKKKLVDWKIVIPFASAKVLFAPIGTLVNNNVSEKPIIIVFAIFTAVSGVLMLLGWRPKKLLNGSKRKRLIIILSLGAILGFTTGFIGRGGGSLVVPVLFMLGLDAKIAAATSVTIISFSAISGLVSHLMLNFTFKPLLWGTCIISVLIGSQLGSRFMAKKLDHRAIKSIFGVVLLIIAIVLIFKDVVLK